jgi:hypothetical protein
MPLRFREGCFSELVSELELFLFAGVRKAIKVIEPLLLKRRFGDHAPPDVRLA